MARAIRPVDRQQKAYLIAEHAMRLFSERGFAAVSTEEISAAAGIGSRTFFRYFPTKESAAFPDHEARVDRFAIVLDATKGSIEPLASLMRASERLTDDYFARPELYRPRYRLIRTEPVLRDYERIMDARYEALIRDFVAAEYPAHPDILFLAPALAASIVATVNAVLDSWSAATDESSTGLLRTALQDLSELFAPAFVS